MTRVRCLNCPEKPVFLSQAQLEDHWSKTHTVPMESNVELPAHLKPFFPESVAKKVSWTEEVKD